MEQWLYFTLITPLDHFATWQRPPITFAGKLPPLVLIKQMEFLVAPLGSVERSLLNMTTVVVLGFMRAVWKLVNSDCAILPFLYVAGLGRASSRSRPCTQGSTTLFCSWRPDTSLTRLSSCAKWVSESWQSVQPINGLAAAVLWPLHVARATAGASRPSEMC